MRAVVKGISNDIFDVEAYCPQNPDNFALSIRVRIGLDCTQGADDFELLICTPRWLEETVWDARWGSGLLIVRDFDFPIINRMINDFVSCCEGESWDAIVKQLRKTFSWEFDNYQC
ncbi:MAG: immunity 8 family protein [Pseudomonas sp.]|uniref:immunity 8 family protein n=1 Tax=Pseudomonas sp. TaxID=306 RepID=UPI003D6E7A82